MDKQKFDDLKWLQYRIAQLSILKQYLSDLLNQRPPFSVEIKITSLGSGVSTNIPQAFGKLEAERFGQFPDDTNFIINAIQVRIDELEKEFNEA